MRINKKLLAICILIPVLVGGLSAFLTSDSMDSFLQLNKPSFAPPAWLFPVVWTILYILMGISSYLVLTAVAPKEDKELALKFYAIQLAVNFLWSTFFFNFQWYFFALLWLLLLWILVFCMIRKFAGINKWAAYINIPYLIWITFAGYLNAGIWWLNR